MLGQMKSVARRVSGATNHKTVPMTVLPDSPPASSSSKSIKGIFRRNKDTNNEYLHVDENVIDGLLKPREPYNSDISSVLHFLHEDKFFDSIRGDIEPWLQELSDKLNSWVTNLAKEVARQVVSHRQQLYRGLIGSMSEHMQQQQELSPPVNPHVTIAPTATNISCQVDSLSQNVTPITIGPTNIGTTSPVIAGITSTVCEVDSKDTEKVMLRNTKSVEASADKSKTLNSDESESISISCHKIPSTDVQEKSSSDKNSSTIGKELKTTESSSKNIANATDLVVDDSTISNVIPKSKIECESNGLTTSNNGATGTDSTSNSGKNSSAVELSQEDNTVQQTSIGSSSNPSSPTAAKNVHTVGSLLTANKVGAE